MPKYEIMVLKKPKPETRQLYLKKAEIKAETKVTGTFLYFQNVN